ncbi:MAG: hypothetical protein MJA83_19740, partial [Gammaproteobacteria bacterium]|nr:hypothetical protein [Gammaproteobacteria bacterium]
MNPEQLLELADRATIVTVNERLARELRRRYESAQIAAGRAVWRRPDMLSWQAFTRRLFEYCLERDSAETDLSQFVLLSGAGSDAVWERIVKTSQTSQALLQIPATARGAREAWERVCQYRVPLTEIEKHSGRDTRAFAKWRKAYSAYCARRKLIDPVTLPDVVIKLLKGVTAPQQKISLLGFDELTPQQQDLLAALEVAGCEWTVEQITGENAEVKKLSCADIQEEMIAAARWARGIVETQAHARVGIVVHDLDQHRDLAVRTFNKVLNPGAVFEFDNEQRAFNISLGLPLAQYPLIHDALTALGLLGKEARYDEIGMLLRSPFFAGAEREYQARAKLDAKIREHGGLTLSLKQLTAFNHSGAPRWRQALRDFAKLTKSAGGVRTNGEWAEFFVRCLQALGWSEGRSLNSVEYQTREAWNDLIDAFARLEAF